MWNEQLMRQQARISKIRVEGSGPSQIRTGGVTMVRFALHVDRQILCIRSRRSDVEASTYQHCSHSSEAVPSTMFQYLGP